MSKKNETPLESKEQETFFEYSDLLWGRFPSLEYLLFATQSGAWLAGNAARRAKQIQAANRRGRKNGVADILCLIPMGEYSGLVIEMKRRTGGKVSQAQKDWLAAAESNGYYVVVAYGADEAIDALNYYLGIS